MVSRVRIGFIGVGGMGQCAHLRNYARFVDDCQVVALAELRPKMAAEVAKRYGITKTYASGAEMIQTETLDGIVCSQPFNRHGVLLKELAGTNLPIFIEKPLCASVAVGEEILQTLAKSTSRVMVGYHKRSDPATEYARGEIDKLKASGELGPMRYVRILMPAGDWVQNGFFDLINTDDPMPQLECDPAEAGMDEKTYGDYMGFVNYYIHQVNLMRHLLGEAYKVTYADPSGVMLAGVSDSGIACTIEMSPYNTTLDWQEQALVAFERGWVRLDLPAPLTLNRPGKVEVFRDPGNGATPVSTIPQMPNVHAMRRQAENFVAFVRGEKAAPCEAAEALEDLKVAREYIRLWKKA